jgi:hypothetical protein
MSVRVSKVLIVASAITLIWASEKRVVAGGAISELKPRGSAFLDQWCSIAVAVRRWQRHNFAGSGQYQLRRYAIRQDVF